MQESNASHQIRPHSMSITDMYLISTKQNHEFGIEGYDFEKKYFDPAKQIEDKKYAEYRKKNQWPKTNTKPALKIPSYLDTLQKKAQLVPGPNKYKMDTNWVTNAEKEKGKLQSKNASKKKTYIDLIFEEQKKRTIPGVGKYNIRKTDDQIKKDIETMKQKEKAQAADRIQYVDTVMWYAAQVPGPGMYHPRKEVKKLKVNQAKPEDWRKKHQDQEKAVKVRSKTSNPGPAQYKNVPVLYNTFDKMQENAKAKTQIKHMGTEERWKDPKKTKSIGTKPVPAPNNYNMIQKWPDAHNKDKIKGHTNYMNKISRGISKSIYYS